MSQGLKHNSLSKNIKRYCKAFYHIFINALNLSGETFKLNVGQNIKLINVLDAALLNLLLDTLPTSSSCIFYQPSQHSHFSTIYAMLFDFATDQESPLYKKAISQYENKDNWQDGIVGSIPIIDPSISEIRNIVENGSTTSFEFRINASHLEDLTTCTCGKWFWGTSTGVLASYVNALAAQNDVVGNITFTQGNVPIKMGKWFSNRFFVFMYTNPDQWQGGQKSWDSIFGPQGVLSYMITAALFATEISISITSKATYSEEEFLFINNNKAVSVWPFYFTIDELGANHSYILNEDMSITSHISITNDIALLGYTVIPVSSLI